MYKRSNQGWLKHIDFILWDEVALQFAFILAFLIRHGRLPYYNPNYRTLGILLVVFDIMIAAGFNTMHNVMKRRFFKELTESLKQVGLVLACMTIYLFSTQSGDIFSRIIIYLTAGLHLVLGMGIRLGWKKVIRRVNRDKPKSTTILVADESDVGEIMEKAGTNEGFDYAGIVLSNRDASGETIAGVPVVANMENAADYFCREWVDEVFIYPSKLADLEIQEFIADAGVAELMNVPEEQKRERTEDPTARLIEQCREMAIPIHIRLPISTVGGKVFVEKVGGYNVLTSTANYATPGQIALKRLTDILGGIVGSIAAVGIIVIVGPKIRKESPGPILFRQTRIGLNGKKFTCYKIRSMYMDAEERKKELMAENRVADGMMFKMKWDPRIIGNKIVDGKQVTGIGEKLRSTSLDEFPQFFNVLKGDMSLVGTRPPTEDEWEKYKYHHRARLATKPGITGMWQVSGRSEITDFEEVVRLDTKYINNWSLGLDVKILLKTVKTVFRREGAM